MDPHVLRERKDADLRPEVAAKKGSAHSRTLVEVVHHGKDLTDVSLAKDDLAPKRCMCQFRVDFVAHEVPQCAVMGVDVGTVKHGHLVNEDEVGLEQKSSPLVVECDVAGLDGAGQVAGRLAAGVEGGP